MYSGSSISLSFVDLVRSIGGGEGIRCGRLGVEGLELGEGASYGKIMSGLVSVGDGRPEGMWEVESCIVRERTKLCRFLPRGL